MSATEVKKVLAVKSFIMYYNSCKTSFSKIKLLNYL